MTIPGKTRKDQSRKRGRRIVRTNVSRAEIERRRLEKERSKKEQYNGRTDTQNKVNKIAKTISEVTEQRWSSKDRSRLAITVDGVFACHPSYKYRAFEDDRIAVDLKAFLEQRHAMQCDSITVTLAWIPGKEEQEEKEDV